MPSLSEVVVVTLVVVSLSHAPPASADHLPFLIIQSERERQREGQKERLREALTQDNDIDRQTLTRLSLATFPYCLH